MFGPIKRNTAVIISSSVCASMRINLVSVSEPAWTLRSQDRDGSLCRAVIDQTDMIHAYEFRGPKYFVKIPSRVGCCGFTSKAEIGINRDNPALDKASCQSNRSEQYRSVLDDRNGSPE